MKPSVERPVKELKAFKKVPLEAGAKTTLELALPAAAFAWYDVAKKSWVAEAGDYLIHVGDSSRSLPSHQIFHLDKTVTIPDAP